MTRLSWVLFSSAFLLACEPNAEPFVTTDRQALIEPGNLVLNPSFEKDTQGWSPSSRATVQRAPDPNAPDGLFVAVLTSSGPTTPSYISLDDAPWTMVGVQAGTTVRARARLKASNDLAFGKIAELSVRELSTAFVSVTQESVTVVLDGGYNPLIVTLTTAAPGSYVEIYVACYSPPANAAVAVDEVTLVVLDAGSGDGGSAASDGGTVDGGQGECTDGSCGPRRLDVGCGCRATATPALLGLVLAAGRILRRRGAARGAATPRRDSTGEPSTLGR